MAWRTPSAPAAGSYDAASVVGLAVVAEIMQAHGGQIQAFNRPDGGSSFRITVPASAVQNQGDGAAAA